jgi:hypothetical protein
MYVAKKYIKIGIKKKSILYSFSLLWWPSLISNPNDKLSKGPSNGLS